MSCFETFFPIYGPYITLSMRDTFTLRGAELQLAGGQVAWGDGRTTSFTYPLAFASLSHEYASENPRAGLSVVGSLHLVAETGESVTRPMGFHAYNKANVAVAVTGDRFTDVIEGGYRADTLNGMEGDDVLRGNGGHDLLIGGAGDDLLEGGAGFNTLHGGAGDDTLMAGTGRDELLGGSGDDWLGHTNFSPCGLNLAGDGRDLLHGGSGADTLVGSGNGRGILHLGVDDDADLVLFTSLNGYDPGTPDSIRGFDLTRDRIQIGYGHLGDDLELVIGADPVATGDRWALLYDTDTGALFLDAPDNLAGWFPPIDINPVQIATIFGAPALTEANFIF